MPPPFGSEAYYFVPGFTERGTWQRLKQCANPVCGVVFHDRSWNNSAALHAWACSEHRGQGDNDRGPMR
jgi:hypothetical protein